MRFAAPIWLWGTGLALALAVVLIVQGVLLSRAKKQLGKPELIDALLTGKTALRRGVRGVLLVLAVALAALAAAGPQYGRGTRVLPATNLDVILVLDYSKSMYAKDVSPSRMQRAKVEVAQLIGALGGARFGAVAFAGDTMAFPITSDGAAIAQFFRGLEPIDMPVGGTSIARALLAAKELLNRDPLSQRHERVIVLVTDGEDLEGDPAAAASDIAADGTRIEVVQIGGRTPEPMFQVDENGREVGLRRDAQGQVMTTFLTPEGEAQLARVASAGGGQVVRAEKGHVGIDVVSERLQKLMTEELSERVETVYAEVYHYPLSAAALLLVLEVLASLGAVRRLPSDPPRGAMHRRKPSRMKQAAVLLALSWLGGLSLGCAEFDRLFYRNSPVVDDAIAALASGDRATATTALTEYLETGPCEAGVIGAGDRARRLGDASLDLGLALAGPFPRKNESASGTGGTSGASVPPAPASPPVVPPPGAPADAAPDPELTSRIDCALRVLSPIAENPDLPSELRARALYLMGNLELSRDGFEPAIDTYDRAVVLAPGLPEGEGDAIGRDIAKNRAIAQRRKQQKEEQEKEKKEQEKGDQDQKDQEKKDEQNDQSDEPKDPNGDDQKEQDQKGDEPKDQQDQKGQDQQSQDQQSPDQKDGEPKDQPDQQASEQDQQGQKEQTPQQSQPNERAAASQDARILDRLEQAPTLEQHDAKQRARTIRMRPTMEDK